MPELAEARGKLLSVVLRNGFAVASFEWGAVAFPEEMQAELATLVGRTVAVLRLDGKFHCRDVGRHA